mgnify:CR=1 FL=1
MRLIIGSCLLFLAGFIAYQESNYETVCNDFEIIEIVSAQHRNVKIKLSNNEIIDIYQPTDVLIKGDTYQHCLKVKI